MTEDKPSEKTRVVASGEVDGIKWLTAEAPLYGAINGYVRLPAGHPWLSLELQYEDYGACSVHGGITFGPTDDGWIGFDTLHAGDWWPAQVSEYHFSPSGGDIHWDASLVATETLRLAQQAKDAA